MLSNHILFLKDVFSMAPMLMKNILYVVRMQSNFDDDFSLISNHWSISLYKSNSYCIPI
jgi:hypothetical protein